MCVYGFGFSMSFRDQFLTANIWYCQNYCLWHSFISRKTGSRDGCLALLSQRLQLTWPWMCIDVLVCCVRVYVCVCMRLACVQGHARHSRSVLLVYATVQVYNCRSVSLKRQCSWYLSDSFSFFLFLFYDLFLPLHNCDWGREPECPVTRGQEVEVGHYKQSPLCTNVLHLTLLFLLEFVRALLTASPPHPFSHSLSLPCQLPSSTFSLPPSHSFLPLFAFAPLIHFQCQLLPFLCQITLPHSLYCVCLTAKERLGRVKQGREEKKAIMLTSN